LGARKGYSIPGILTVALVSSVGGGLLRDGLFIQNGPPAILRTPVYLSLIAVAVMIILLFGHYIRRFRYLHHAVGLVDALGLGAYAVVGMDRALVAGLSLPGVVLVGTVNAVGGGILRDVLMNREPVMFQPGTLEEVLAIVGCVFFVILARFLSVDLYIAAWLTIALVFLLRALAVRYGIRSRPVRGFAPEEEDGGKT
jgi:uncharacterized membrane protein YeiH